MTDRPILMSAPMVRAILREIEQPGSGKTMTRRLAWRERKMSNAMRQAMIDTGVNPLVPTIWQSVRPGNRLWLRETWRTHAMFDAIRPSDLTTASIHYDCDGPVKSGKTRVSIHMPRRYSHITLIVTATRMERLQEISEADARAEGITRTEEVVCPLYRSGAFDRQGEITALSARTCFARLWDHIHRKPGHRWEDNPGVVPVTFVPHLANIDAMALQEDG